MSKRQRRKEESVIEILKPNMFNVTLTVLFLAFVAGTSLIPFFTLQDIATRLPTGSAFRTLEAIIFSAGVFILASVVAYELRKQHLGDKF
jgi:uncharacterized membrane protein (DUF485 family)